MNNIHLFRKTPSFRQKVIPYIPCKFRNREQHHINRNTGSAARVWSRAFILGTTGLGASSLAKKTIIHCKDFEQPKKIYTEKIDQIYREIFPGSDDLHFTKEDILLIGRCIVGLRHVSSEDHAHQNATEGIKNGCSINASFHGGNSIDTLSTTALLDDRVRDGKDCSLEIYEYEQLLKRFIRDSIGLDIKNDPNNRNHWHGGSRFMVVGDTHGPSKCDVFYGIGRLGPSNIPPKKIFLLKPPTSAELEMLEHIPLTDLDRENLVRERVARLYLSRFIQFIRTEFNPNQFHATYEWAHYEKCHPSKEALVCLGKLRSTRSTDPDKILDNLVDL